MGLSILIRITRAIRSN